MKTLKYLISMAAVLSVLNVLSSKKVPISNPVQQATLTNSKAAAVDLTKESNSNICIDHGVGAGGSGGFFLNLGEVF